MHEWFPHVFQHIDSESQKLAEDPNQPLVPQTSDPKLPDWCLLVKENAKFVILEVLFPNGSTLYEHKGRFKAGIPDCHLWFGAS